ncbi:hypothetical protein Misp06_02067 [Microbulbifer sp. NBRC 101763]
MPSSEMSGIPMFGLLADAAAETLFEAVHASTGSSLLLLARIEGVALGAHIDLQVFAQGRTGFDYVSAGASGGDVGVVRMDICFHDCLFSKPPLDLLPGTVSSLEQEPDRFQAD